MLIILVVKKLIVCEKCIRSLLIIHSFFGICVHAICDWNLYKTRTFNMRVNNTNLTIKLDYFVKLINLYTPLRLNINNFIISIAISYIQVQWSEISK